MTTESKIWTVSDALDRIRLDCDLGEDDADEQFITLDEFVGYMNKGINQAESLIHKIDEDYFLSNEAVPLVTGEDEYPLPRNIYARKIRGIVYSSGTTIYQVKKFRRGQKFIHIAHATQYAGSEDYQYYLVNKSPGEVRMKLIPASRETAVCPPLPSESTPMTTWFLRNASRVPLTGEYCNPEDILNTSVDASANTIAVSPDLPYETGDAVKLSVVGSSTVPTGLAVDTVYYVIDISDTSIKLATTAALAAAGTAIDITAQGTGFFTLRVAATSAIINATPLDIPEFMTYVIEWVKLNCILKDGDPRLDAFSVLLSQEEKSMVETLTDSEPDDDNEVEMDLSHYHDMN